VKDSLLPVTVFVLGLLIVTLDAQQPQTTQPQQVHTNNTPTPAPLVAAPDIKEPDWDKVPYLFTDSGLVSLERQQYVIRKGFMDTAYFFNSATSPVRVQTSATFVIKLDSGDPSAQIFIDKISIEKNKRKAVSSKTTMTGSATQTSGVIPLGFKKYGSSVKVIPMSPLQEGEYLVSVLSSSGELSCYLFGVDKPNGSATR